ncbi:auxin-induced in root cultures protein 12-like [Cucurbita maxima]|uniref:Auxin-induced in root cultures protein 12-like n=1 Tax=Cucurbita maxima TaxID=3661 RepID=A0A6J1JNY3_CUCMA|nr:auxin-induced in root cultures protein 12-like [Cucurbita maxima]
MASLGNALLSVCLIGSLISQAQSLTCSSQTFPKRSFAHCEDLPELGAFLHWTHDPKNSSLSIAFIATPPHEEGWVAWAVNPTHTGMIGAQALIASQSGGTPSVRTFNISSYSVVLPSHSLSFPVWDVAAECSDEQFTIFATVKVPEKAKSLNQVWQVGPGVNPHSGIPKVHAFDSSNFNAENELVFDKEGGADLAPHAHHDASPAPEASTTAASSGVAQITTKNFINYDAIKADVSPGCSPKHPNLCKTHEANSYQRGCNAINQCRGDDIINAVEKIDVKHSDIINSEGKAGTDEIVGKLKEGMVKGSTRKINPGALENNSIN